MKTREELEAQLETRKCIILYLVDLLGGEVVISRDVYENLWQGYEYRTECNEASVTIQSRKIHSEDKVEVSIEEKSSIHYIENDEDFDE
jgi:hypothetical protein